jgi:hypothetical protein
VCVRVLPATVTYTRAQSTFAVLGGLLQLQQIVSHPHDLPGPSRSCRPRQTVGLWKAPAGCVRGLLACCDCCCNE